MSTAATPQVHRGFPVCCPHCHEEGAVMLYANEVTLFHCNECSEDITAADVAKFFRQAEGWRRLLAWCETAPPMPEGD